MFTPIPEQYGVSHRTPSLSLSHGNLDKPRRPIKRDAGRNSCSIWSSAAPRRDRRYDVSLGDLSFEIYSAPIDGGSATRGCRRSPTATPLISPLRPRRFAPLTPRRNGRPAPSPESIPSRPAAVPMSLPARWRRRSRDSGPPRRQCRRDVRQDGHVGLADRSGPPDRPRHRPAGTQPGVSRHPDVARGRASLLDRVDLVRRAREGHGCRSSRRSGRSRPPPRAPRNLPRSPSMSAARSTSGAGWW